MVWQGSIVALHLTERASAEMEAKDLITLLEGQAVEGDRYMTGRGFHSNKPAADHQLPLIEIETNAALLRDHDLDLALHENRRDITTRGVPLRLLVGCEFRVGGAILFGGGLSTPCRYIETLIDKRVHDPRINRSGLNCEFRT